MSVIEAHELWEGRDGSETIKRQRQYTRTFEVWTDSPYDGPNVVRSSTMLPQLGFPYVSAFESDSGALVVSINPTQSSEDPTLWKVTVKYDSKLDFPEAQQKPGDQGNQPKDKPQSPAAKPIVYKFGSQKEKRPWIYDGDGKAIVNTAGMPFDPPLEEDIAYLTISMTVNKAVWWGIDGADLIFGVNKKLWYGIEPRMVKIEAVEAQSKYENNFGFWEVVWSLIVNREKWGAQGDPPYIGGQGWDRRILDCGFYESVDDPAYVGAPPIPKIHRKIMDGRGKEPTAAVPLKFGRKILPGDEANFITYPAKKQIDFNGLVP